MTDKTVFVWKRDKRGGFFPAIIFNYAHENYYQSNGKVKHLQHDLAAIHPLSTAEYSEVCSLTSPHTSPMTELAKRYPPPKTV